MKNITNEFSREAFIRYMKQKGVFGAFKKNFSLYYIKKFHPEIYKKVKTSKEYFNEVPAKSYLEFAFPWNQSKEGFDFWCAISDEWKSIYNPYSAKKTFSEIEIC